MGRLLYEDENVKLDAGMFGGITVTDKNFGNSRKLVVEERRWVSDAIETARKNGVPIEPDIPALNRFFEQVGQAVTVGGARWRAFFLSETGVQAGEAIANEYQKDRES